jgi:hypothetical protein
MARLYTPQTAGVLDGTLPAAKLNGGRQHAKLRRLSALIDLAALGVTTADEVLLGRLPPGAFFVYGIINASVTMGASATLAIGTNPVHASNGQYRAAATFTTAVPTLFGVAAAAQAAASANPTDVFLTVGVANLPSSGLLNIDIFYSVPA